MEVTEESKLPELPSEIKKRPLKEEFDEAMLELDRKIEENRQIADENRFKRR
jgi:hypothetical protein